VPTGDPSRVKLVATVWETITTPLHCRSTVKPLQAGSTRLTPGSFKAAEGRQLRGKKLVERDVHLGCEYGLGRLHRRKGGTQRQLLR
jgi:hypothetical protein